MGTKGRTITEFAILSLLTERPMYGAEMADEIKRLSGGTVCMPLQTLYSALKKMDARKIVRSYWREAAVGGRCRVYNITGMGREYYKANKIEIDYESLKTQAASQKKQSPKHEHQVYATLEEAFSLPLTKETAGMPASDADTPIERPVPVPAEIPARAILTNTYILPTEQILSTQENKQMSFNISGIQTNTNLRPFVRLNSVQVQSGFVLINRLRFFAGVCVIPIFAIIYSILCLTLTKWNVIYTFAFVGLAVYFGIDLIFWLIFPKVKSRPRYLKAVLMRGAISAVLLLIVISVYLMNVPQLVNSEPLVFGLIPAVFSFLPFFEGLVILILRKGRFFAC